MEGLGRAENIVSAMEGNEDKNWPYEEGCQKLFSEILCTHHQMGNVLL